MFGCGRLIRVLCFFLRVVVGVSCSVVGPKRYERWGVVYFYFRANPSSKNQKLGRSEKACVEGGE